MSPERPRAGRAVAVFTVEVGSGDRASALDGALAAHFPSRPGLARCLSSADHPGHSKEELVDLIATTGTDRYDPSRRQVGHDFYGRWKIDFFASEVVPGQPHFAEILDDFAVGALEDRGHPVDVDIVTIYDPAHCLMVRDVYDDVEESDAYVFASPNDKVGALLGILVV